jgi:class 3 adenylate cyclase
VAKKIGFFASLRFKFALTLALFGGLLTLSVLIFLENSLRQTLIRESIEKGLGVARGVAFNAEDPLLTGDDLYLFSAIKNATRSAGIRYALIVDNQDQIRAAGDISRVGQQFKLSDANRIDKQPGYQVHRIKKNQSSLLDLEVPILTVSDTPIRLGAIHLGLSEDLIAQEIANMRNSLILISLITLVVGVIIAYLLAGLSMRPFRILVKGVRAIGAGDMDQHIKLKGKNEFAVLAEAFNDMALNLREKEFIKSTFERYVSKELVTDLLKRKDEIKLGGDEVTVSILFSDIRRFTSLAERLPPAQVVELLNAYFSRMIAVVNEHNGMVDKLMGDSVMALFGVPLSSQDDALNAVKCAIAMQKEVVLFNQERADQGLPVLEMGIGINTGKVIAGNIGSPERMEYTVIGDNVNVAARLQGIAKPGQVLISDATFDQVKDKVIGTQLEPTALKGKRIPVGVYRIDSMREI